MKLTENFDLSEMISSNTAIIDHIANVPGPEETEHLKALCVNILQPLRNAVGTIHISSGFRSEALNKRVGGAATSQHVLGEAADITMPDMAKAFIYIKNHLPYDQLIWENGNDCQPSWIHVSYSDRNRRQILRKHSGSSHYEAFGGPKQ